MRGLPQGPVWLDADRGARLPLSDRLDVRTTGPTRIAALTMGSAPRRTASDAGGWLGYRAYGSSDRRNPSPVTMAGSTTGTSPDSGRTTRMGEASRTSFWMSTPGMTLMSAMPRDVR